MKGRTETEIRIWVKTVMLGRCKYGKDLNRMGRNKVELFPGGLLGGSESSVLSITSFQRLNRLSISSYGNHIMYNEVCSQEPWGFTLSQK